MSPRSISRLRSLLAAGFGVALLSAAWSAPVAAQSPAPGTGPLRQATFELRNEVKVKVPDGARRVVRVWMAVPQDNDPAQQVRDLKIETPYPYRVETEDGEPVNALPKAYIEVDGKTS